MIDPLLTALDAITQHQAALLEDYRILLAQPDALTLGRRTAVLEHFGALEAMASTLRTMLPPPRQAAPPIIVRPSTVRALPAPPQPAARVTVEASLSWWARRDVDFYQEAHRRHA